MKELQRSCEAIAEETERAVAFCDTRKLYQAFKIIRDRPTEVVRCYLNKVEASSQTKPEKYVGGRSTSKGSLIM